MDKIALIQVVRDDTDILFNNWVYYYNIGVRDFYIMLHMPEPEHFNIVEEFKDWFNDITIKVFVNTIDLHYHDKDCKVLTDAARADGFTWILGSDADELLVLRKHETIYDFLKDYPPDYYSIQFKFGTYPPLGNVPEHVNAFTHLTGRDPEWRKEEKSIGRFNDVMFYVPGLHFIMNAPRQIHVDPDTAFYAHFPDRTEAQFEKKYLIQNKNWLERYGQFPLSEQIAKDPDFLKKHWADTCNFNLTKTLVNDPIDPRLFQL